MNLGKFPKCCLFILSPQVDLLDHLFNIYQVNVTQTCDACASYIRGMEKAYICSGEFREQQQVKTTGRPQKNSSFFSIFYFSLQFNMSQEMSEQNWDTLLKTVLGENWFILNTHTSVCQDCLLMFIIFHVNTPYHVWQNGRVSGSLYFGVQVSVLISDTNSVPKVMEMLLLHVELNGLYTEGIYRKSGSACRAKELQQILDTGKKLSRHWFNSQNTRVYLENGDIIICILWSISSVCLFCGIRSWVGVFRKLPHPHHHRPG